MYLIFNNLQNKYYEIFHLMSRPKIGLQDLY